MSYGKNITQKFLWLLIFNVIVWGACSIDWLGYVGVPKAFANLVGALPLVFKVMFSTFSLCGLIMFMIHETGMLKKEGSSIGRLIKFFFFYILIGFGSIFGIIWLVMGYYGFFPVFIWTVVVYAWIAFLILVALDAKPMKEQTPAAGMANLIILYLVMCVGFVTMGYALPQYEPRWEIKKLIGDRGDLSKADKPTLIKVGSEIFKDFECFNCHNASPGGIEKRGPNLATTAIGGDSNIMENIVEPQKVISKGYDKPKIRNAMPDYYGKQIKPLERKALVEFLKSLQAAASVSTEEMPEGWWKDPKVIEEGGKIYEGLVNDDVMCGACHGSEGPPLMEGARDFRDKKYMDSRTDKELFDAITDGVVDANGDPTPMTEWGSMINPGQRWKVLAYIFDSFTGGRKDLGTLSGETGEKKEKRIWQPWPFGTYPFGKDTGEDPAPLEGSEGSG